MKRITILILALALGALLIPQRWVSLGAPNVSGSIFRSFAEPQGQEAPERLAELSKLDSLPLADAGDAPLGRDPRRWREFLGSKTNQRFQEVFPGVDLVFAGNAKRMEAVLIVKPGVDPASVRFDFPQAEALAADAQGTVWVAMANGDLGLMRARLSRRGAEVNGGFVAQGSRVALQVSEPDASQGLLVRFDVVFPTRPVNLLDQILYRVFKSEKTDSLRSAPASPSSPSATTVTATKTVDNATSAPGGTLMYTVTITNTGASTADGIKFTDTIDANTTLIGSSVNVQPIANADAYNVIGNVRIQPNAAQGLLANDCDPTVSGCTISGLTVTALTGVATDNTLPYSITTTNGATVTASATDGSFQYNPAPGFNGTDTFTYTIRDAGADGIPGNADDKTDTGTVTLTVSAPIWFIDNTAAACTTLAGGCGRLTNPFSSLAAFQALNNGAGNNPAANDNIFIFASGTAYTGPVTLLNGQKLIGQGASTTLATILGLTVEAYSDPLPTLNNMQSTVAITTSVAATNAITLGMNNLLRGFTVGDTTASDIIGTGFGTLAISEVTLNGTGRALNLTTGSFAAGSAITSISVTSTTSNADGITLSAITGANSPSFGATTISSTNGTGSGININGSSTPFTFSSVAVDNTGAAGVALTNNTGAISIGGTIGASNDPTGNDVDIDQGNANITISASLTKSTAGRIVEITGRTGTATVDITGSLSCTSGCTGINVQNNTSGTTTTINFSNATKTLNTGASAAVTLDNNDNATINFSGGNLDIDTTSGTGFNAINGAVGINVTGSNNTINSTSGAALNVSSSNIGASGLTFQSISSGAGTNNGIALNTTGASGGLTVTGDGTNTSVGGNSTGGTISGKSGADLSFATQGCGIYLNSTSNVVLRRMTINGTNQNYGIRGTLVSGFILEYSTVGGTNGTNFNTAPYNAGEGSIYFGDISTNGLSGTATFTNNNISGGDWDNFRVITTQATPNVLTLSVKGNTFGANLNNAESNASMTVENRGTGTINTTLGGTLAGEPNTFTAAKANLVNFTGQTTSVMDVVMRNNIMSNNHAGNIVGGCSLTLATQGAMTFHVTGNTMRDANGSAVTFQKASAGTSLSGFFSGNTIGVAAVADSGSKTGNGLFFSYAGAGSGLVTVTNNAIHQIHGNFHISADNTGGSYQASFDIRGNTFDTPVLPFNAGAIGMTNGSPGSGDTVNVCAIIGGSAAADKNTISGYGAGVQTIFLGSSGVNNSATHIFNLPGLATFTEAGVESFVATNNNMGGTIVDAYVDAPATFAAFKGNAGCGTPTSFAPPIETDLQQAAPHSNGNDAALATPPPVESGGSRSIIGTLMRPVFSAYAVSMGYINPLKWFEGSASAAPANLTTEKSTVEAKPAAKAEAQQPARHSAQQRPQRPQRTEGRTETPQRQQPRPPVHVLSSPESGETVMIGGVSGFSLAPGDSVVIMFSVTVNNSIPAGTCSVQNQGSVSSATASFPTVLTDNAPGGGPADPTVTTLQIAPSAITCPSPITVNTDPGQCTAAVTFTTPTSTGCPVPTVTCNPASGFAFPKGLTTVTCTAHNTSGPDTTCSFTVTVNDMQAPTLTCSAPVMANTAAGLCTAVVTYTTTITDNCPGATFTCTPASGATFVKGVTTVMCTGMDMNGNAAAPCSFTVTVVDNQNPVIGACPANITQPATTGQCSAVVTYTAPTATDNCGAAPVVCAPASGSTFNVGTTTVTCTATDTSNRTASCMFTVTIQDTQAPTIMCPANVTVSSNVPIIVNYSAPTASDNCGTPTVVCVPASGTVFPVGTTTVTCTASDTSAQSPDATCMFTVSVVPCTVVCPGNQTATAAMGSCAAMVNYPAPTTTGTCGTVTCVPASGITSFPVGITTVTCTSAAGPSCMFTVTVTDTQLPVLGACPANITQPATNGSCAAVVTFTNPTATDNCPAGLVVTCTPASGASFPVGTTTVSCKATDASNNMSAPCTFTVTVTDTQLPVLGACPANISTTATAGTCAATVTFTNPTVSDNCPGATVTCTPASGASFTVGTTTVSCKATDASNNMSAPCTFTVTITDTQLPVLGACPANITNFPATTGQCSATVTFTNPTVSDNCPGATVTCTPASGSTFNVGTTTVSCKATDASNNMSAPCTFTVQVVDTQLPVLGACPANITNFPATNGSCAAVVTFTNPTATDNCPTGLTVTCTPASGASFPVGTTTVSCKATDASNNMSAPCTFTVQVVDTQLPVLGACPANITQPAAAGQCAATITFTNPTVSDNCPGATVTCTPASGTSFNVGTTTVSCKATDASNNMSAPCTFTVTITDTQLPVLGACPANITNRPATTGACSAVVTFTNPTATDNCGTPTVTCTPASGASFPVGTTTVSCKATDASNNMSAPCTFTVTVQDTQAPTITCPANQTVPSNVPIVVNFPAPTASDNCGTPTVTCVPASGTTFAVGTTTVTCTASDSSAQSPDATCMFTVTVVPCTITCPSNITVSNSVGQCGATVTYPAPTTTAACGTVTCTPASGSFFAKGTTTVNCSTTAGPSCNFTVTVNDTEAPVIMCPAGVPKVSFGPTVVVTYPTPPATDNCSGVGTVTCSPASGSSFPLGMTTVTCNVTDAAGNPASCNFVVTVKTPEQALMDLIGNVQALVPPLSNTQATGLISKLDGALKDLKNKDNLAPACLKLSSFISQVQALISGGTLTLAQGQPLIDSANLIREALGCGNNLSGGSPKTANDFDGDGKTDLALWDTRNGEWQIIRSNNNVELFLLPDGNVDPLNDVIVPGDYDGDGKTDAAVFHRSTGQWSIKRSSDGQTITHSWGVGTDVAVPADYDGDGKTDLAVWRSSEGRWYIQRSSDNQTQTVEWGSGELSVADVPVPADYDGDGQADVAVFRRSNGVWYIKSSVDGSTISKAFGLGTDVPVPADYDGDGKADIAVWRGSIGMWFIANSSNNTAYKVVWGASSRGDIPVPGDYDGDGKADIAVWRSSEAAWYIKLSLDQSEVTKSQGSISNVPVQAATRR